MADDMLIGVGVKADFSSLKTESVAGAQAVEQMAQRITGASSLASGGIEKLGAAHAHMVPQVAAASGAIRVFEGVLPIRAVERFLTTTLGLGPALQMAFPLVGAIAFAEMLGHVAGEVDHFIEKTLAVPGAIAQGFGQVSSQVRDSNDELALTNVRLEAEIAKLEHRPANMLAVALAEARVEADRLASSLEKDFGEVQKLLKDQSISVIGASLTGQDPTKMMADQVGSYVKALEGIDQKRKDALHGLTDPAQIAGVDRQYNDEWMKQAQKARDEMAHYWNSGQKFGNQKADAGNLAIAGGFAHMLEDEMDKRREAVQQGADQQKLAEDQAAQQRAEAAKKAAEEARKAEEEHRKAVGLVLTEGIEDYKRAQREKEEISEGISKAGIQSLTAEADAEKKATEQEEKDNEKLKRAWEEKIALMQEAARTEMERNVGNIDEAMNSVRSTASMGGMNGAQELAALEDFIAQKKMVQKDYFDYVSGLAIGNDKKLAEIDRQRAAAEKENDRDESRAQDAAAKTQEQGYRRLTDSMSRDFTGAMDRILLGQVSIGQGAEQMASRMMISFANAMVDMALHEIIGLALHKTMNADQRLDDAKTAAAGAYKATVGIPIIGPVLAPIAAGAAFAAVAAFEQGGVQEITGPAYLHAGERVLTAKQTGTFDYVMNNAIKASGKSTTLNFGSSTFHGVADQKTFAQLVKKNNRDVAKSVQRALRNGHLG